MEMAGSFLWPNVFGWLDVILESKSIDKKPLCKAHALFSKALHSPKMCMAIDVLGPGVLTLHNLSLESPGAHFTQVRVILWKKRTFFLHRKRDLFLQHDVFLCL